MKINLNTIIIGAGPSGIGCMLALRRAGIDKVLLLEGNTVGSSFKRWPKQMRLITPSFYGNPFFCTDLNAISPNTSPADHSKKEHISGSEYADYLSAIVNHYNLNIRENEKALEITPNSTGFSVKTAKANYNATTLIWAGGEFLNPKLGNFDGNEFCTHSSEFNDWKDYKHDEAFIIGGYESGIDAAYNLINLNKKVTLLSSDQPWNSKNLDPSETLSPYTRERLLEIIESYPNRLSLIGNSRVVRIKKISSKYIIHTSSGKLFESDQKPISATGFHSALNPIKKLWEWNGSIPKFTNDDESTLYPGLYYSGPSLVHRGSKFCFIYKFRGRFGVIARSIAKRIDYPYNHKEIETHRGFLIDDLECCTQCDCAVESKDTKVLGSDNLDINPSTMN